MAHTRDTYQSQLSIHSDELLDNLLKELPDFSQMFFNSLKQKNRSSLTRLQYAYDLKRFFDWIKSCAGFKDVNIYTASPSEILDKLTIQDIQEFIKTLETYDVTNAKGKVTKVKSSEASIARKASCLRAFYAYYYKLGLIDNATMSRNIDVPKIKDKEILSLKKDEIDRIFNYIDSIITENKNEVTRRTALRDKTIITLLYGTGIRVSELIGINLDDVDFYRFIKNKDEDPYGSILITRKGNTESLLYLDDYICSVLADYIENTRNTFFRDYDGHLIIDPDDEPALFLSTHHKRLTVRSVELMVKKYAEQAGISIKTTPHSLRRSYGTSVYNASGDIYLVADLLGHKSVETTKKHYAKMDQEKIKKAVKYSKGLFDDSNN